MVEYKSKCEGCYDEGGICIGECDSTETRTLYCDECGEEVSELYAYRGDELCKHCLLKEAEIKGDSLYD